MQQQDVSPSAIQSSQGRRVTWSDINVYHALPEAPAASTSDHHEEPPPVGCWTGCKQRVKALKREVLALHYAVHDPRTPLAAKLLPLVAITYALSPLDLIPDFIPVLGLLDDLLLLPGLLWLSVQLIPHQVMDECRVRAELEPLQLARAWHVAALIAAAWTALLLVGVHYAIQWRGTADMREYEWAALAGSGGLCCIAFVLWLVLAMRHERRRREEWNAALLQHAGVGA